MSNLSKTWIIIVIFFATLIIGGSLLYNKTLNKSVPLQSSLFSNQSQLPPGLKKVQMIAETYPKLLKGTIIQQQIEGILKEVNLNSWTLEKDGQTIILNQEGITQVQYFKLPKVTTSSAKLSVPVEIKAKDIQIGNRISIYQTIDYQTGKTTITSVTLLGKE